MRATVQWATFERDVPPVVTALATAGVRVAPIKGLAYAKALYASPVERPMSDVDLLVPAAETDRARRALTSLGFTRGPTAALHHAEPWSRGDLAIDLHWTIIAPGRSQIDLDGLWARATHDGWPAGAHRLEPVDALAFHLVHLVRNRLRLPLMNVVDAARLLEHADAAAVLARGRDWGLGRAMAMALRFCQSILDDRPGRPAGPLGPSRDEVALLTEPHGTSKLAFDIAVAGSLRQLASRVVHYGANRLRRQ